jgi:hypothetical protein
MTQYIINLTETEDKALSYAAMSQDAWIQNAVHERCRIAIDEIVGIAVQHFLATGVQIPGSKEEIVALAFSTGLVKTVVQQNEEAQAQAEAEAAARAAQQAGEQP